MSESTRADGGGVLVPTLPYRPEPNVITADVAGRLAATGPVTVDTTDPDDPFGRLYAGVGRAWPPRRTVEQGDLSGGRAARARAP